MSDELKYSLEKLSSAIKRLDEGVKEAKDNLGRDGVIQRFEFTFELLWKTLRLFLLDEGIITKSPKESLKEGFKFGLIKDEEIFLDMLEDINLTSHIYSEEVTKEIFKRIKTRYLNPLKKILNEIKKSTKN
ncbi:MAG: nucleotidyltransferase substrate binding protein [Bacteroidetes bacterium]|nr:nucleotidyltransferase substrate binding protein [Bacteroidota bacterium]